MSERLSRAEFVLKKYRLSELTFIECEENGAKLGNGKLMADETFNRFVEGDPSGNLKYLDWMLFQAGGGQDAMDKSLSLWQGESDADPTSLRNQCRLDYIDEQVRGYVDEHGVKHPPISREEATAAWKHCEERSKFEFLMGDQDVAVEDGYGFFRHWPGKNGIYQKILNSVKLWHSAQAKLLSRNQRHERWERLKGVAHGLWTADDQVFMRKCQDSPPAPPLVLDLYSGWKPKDYAQPGAVYKNLVDLLRALADVRKMQILKDTRCDKVYENDLVSAVCPLTIGASMKYGIGKWCVCNRTEFDRYFEIREAGEGNWQRYNRQGPLVFLTWKVPMPPWLHKLAFHIPNDRLHLIQDGNNFHWIDCQNQQRATNYSDVVTRIRAEHMRSPEPEHNFSSDELYYKWGGRRPGVAWNRAEMGDSVLHTLSQVIKAVAAWGASFDTRRIVLDFALEVGALVDKSDE